MPMLTLWARRCAPRSASPPPNSFLRPSHFRLYSGSDSTNCHAVDAYSSRADESSQLSWHAASAFISKSWEGGVEPTWDAKGVVNEVDNINVQKITFCAAVGGALGILAHNDSQKGGNNG